MRNLTINNIKSVENSDKRLIVITHYGIFHSDDVLAVALLTHYVGKNANVDVIRVSHQADVRKIKEFLEKGGVEVFIVDVGREYNSAEKMFDHHQFSPDEFGHAAAGLVYKYLKDNDYINEFEQEELEPLVDMVDKNDVGKWEGPYEGTFPWIVAIHNDNDIYSSEQDKRFVDAVKLALRILEDIADRSEVKMKSLEALKKSKEILPGVLELPKYLPGWNDLIFKLPEFDDIDLVIWHDDVQGKWKVQQVPDKPGSFGRRGRAVPYREPLPEGCEFLHRGNFFGVFNSKEALIDYIKSI